MEERRLQEHINEDTKDKIQVLFNHAEVANREMGDVKTTLGIVQSDIAWLKKQSWAMISVMVMILIKLFIK